jgi:hypothetical protein
MKLTATFEEAEEGVEESKTNLLEALRTIQKGKDWLLGQPPCAVGRQIWPLAFSNYHSEVNKSV